MNMTAEEMIREQLKEIRERQKWIEANDASGQLAERFKVAADKIESLCARLERIKEMRRIKFFISVANVDPLLEIDKSIKERENGRNG